MMFSLTTQAAEQISYSAKHGHLTGLALRIIAQQRPDGSIYYGMGFDDIYQDDIHLHMHGVDIVLNQCYEELLDGTIMDYVELKKGDFRFIFTNPNEHKKPIN